MIPLLVPRHCSTVSHVKRRATNCKCGKPVRLNQGNCLECHRIASTQFRARQKRNYEVARAAYLREIAQKASGMSDSMVERVARAICSLEIDPGPNLLTGVPRWHGYVPAARAAIEAMHEPTEAVLDAGWDTGCLEAGPNDSATIVWKAMISAALKESP